MADKDDKDNKTPGPSPYRRQWILFVIVMLLSLAADQATKIWARAELETERYGSQDPTYTKTGSCDVPDDMIPRPIPARPDKEWVPCGGKNATVIGTFWRWRLSMNPGSAFGLFAGHPGLARIFLSVVGIVAVGGMLWMLRKARPDQKVLHWALALVAGGAIGNLIDRIAYGVVTDFIVWAAGGHEWPVFNVADVVLVVGVGLMFIDIQKEGKREKKLAKGKARDEKARAHGLVKDLRE
jgi:signal peptidase II